MVSPKLFRVHLAKAFIALYAGVLAECLLRGAQLRFGIGVDGLAAPVYAVEWRSANIDMACCEQITEITVEERQQNRADVRAVLIGVRKNNDLVVLQILFFKYAVEAGAERGDDGAKFLVLNHLVGSFFLHVERLAAQGAGWA